MTDKILAVGLQVVVAVAGWKLLVRSLRRVFDSTQGHWFWGRALQENAALLVGLAGGLCGLLGPVLQFSGFNDWDPWIGLVCLGVMVLFWLGVWFLEAEARRHPRVDVYPAVNAAISRGARI